MNRRIFAPAYGVVCPLEVGGGGFMSRNRLHTIHQRYSSASVSTEQFTADTRKCDEFPNDGVWLVAQHNLEIAGRHRTLWCGEQPFRGLHLQGNKRGGRTGRIDHCY